MKRSNRVWLTTQQGWIVTIFFWGGMAFAQPLIDVLPRSPKLPANFLKFYLLFPEKMERGVAFEHITLFEELDSGKLKPVLDPFREIELWDKTGQRMTLWLHPGRQKPGVNLNVEFGPVLEAGKRYQLVISKAWRTEAGTLLAEDSAYRFEAGKADTTQPNPRRWKVTGQRNDIVIEPWESLDPVSFADSVRVKSPGDETLRKLDDPALATLKSGKYQLVIDPKLEDLAGNSVERPFNVDLKKKPNFKERTEPVVLDFQVTQRSISTPCPSPHPNREIPCRTPDSHPFAPR